MLVYPRSSVPRLLSCAALSVFAVLPNAARSEEIITLDPIIVRARDQVGDAADRATAVYVSDAELDRARMGDARDLFNGIASVNVGSSIPVSQKIFVNGIDIVNLTTTIDGVMQNNRTFHHTSATVFDPGLLKFVRVDPGIAAADSGPNAVAGAVVMETIDAADFLEDGDQFGGNIRLSYDQNGETFGRALTLVGQAEGFEILAYGRLLTGDDYEDGDSVAIEGTAADITSGLLKAAYESPSGHRFEASAQTLIDDAERPYRADIGEFVGGEPTPKTRVYDTERNSYAFNYEFLKGGSLLNPKFTIGYSDASVNILDPYGSKSTASTLSARLQNTFQFSETDSLVAGFDYYDKQSDYDDDFDKGLNENAQNVGFFAQARFEPTDRLKISAGARYDMQDFEGSDGYKDEVSGWSGNASVSYLLTEEFSVRAGYSSVFGGLQLEDSYQFWGPVYDDWEYEGLKPSRSNNYSAGFDWFSAFGFTVGGELFRIEIDNARHLGETSDIESEGFNLGAAYSWDLGSARLTYTDSKVTSDGSEADSFTLRGYGTPIGQVLALQVQQLIPQYNLLVGGSANIAWDQSVDGDFVEKDLEGYEVFDLFAEWSPASFEGLTVRAEVANLFDATYADRATYGAEFTDIVQLTEPGRSFGIEAFYQF